MLDFFLNFGYNKPIKGVLRFFGSFRVCGAHLPEPQTVSRIGVKAAK